MVIGTHTMDFKEQNQHLTSTIREFSNMYQQESSALASKILWSAFFVAIIANPKNPFRNFKSDDQRTEEIQKLYCPEYKRSYEYLEKIFRSICLSKEHTLYNIHLRKYEEFVAQFDELELGTDDGWKKYLDASAKLEKITNFYDGLEKKYSESELKTTAKEGGGNFTVAELRNMERKQN